MKNQPRTIAVIGGGAAGFFTAVNAADMNPDLNITIFEKSREVLSKVRISGGGRCNVTHHCFDAEVMSKHYPRGEKTLRWSFERFQPKDTVEWFGQRNVELKAEADGRMFPVTDDSGTIIECLMSEANKAGVRVRTKTRVESVIPLSDGGFELVLPKNEKLRFDSVVIATGGASRLSAYQWIEALGHSIIPPVPSLFTFNFREKVFKELAGISVEQAQVRIAGLRYEEVGPVLFTHWGVSGPAVLKLSAWAARELFDKEYRFDVEINWLHPMNEQQVRNALVELRQNNSRKMASRQDRFPFPGRLWEKFLELAAVPRKKRWAELSNRELHNLTQQLVHATYNIQGKTTYKEEFVTCGGIPLNEVNPDTMESKKVPGLYFVGEVLDIDGITGGFNFQAAWTNGWIAAQHLSDNKI
jgi:predicted Rossmann fold flavoprotein